MSRYDEIIQTQNTCEYVYEYGFECSVQVYECDVLSSFKGTIYRGQLKPRNFKLNLERVLGASK